MSHHHTHGLDDHAFARLCRSAVDALPAHACMDLEIAVEAVAWRISNCDRVQALTGATLLRTALLNREAQARGEAER